MSKEPLTGTDKLWSDLSSLEPKDVCARSGTSFSSGCYEIDFMNGRYRLDIADRSVSGPESHPPSDGELALLFLAYLVDAKDMELGGKWISEKEVPGGSLFFTGPHKMPVDGIAGKYGTAPKGLVTKALVFGGTALEYGDASVAFKALPRIPLAFVLWEEDDEFPAEVTVMFDETIHRHIPVDVILALVSSVVKFL
jgi:hypothetical protein